MIVTFIEIAGADYALIDKGNGEFSTMMKADWDKLEAEREQSGTL